MIIGYFLDIDVYSKVALSGDKLTRARAMLLQRQWDAILSCINDDAEFGIAHASLCDTKLILLPDILCVAYNHMLVVCVHTA